MCERPESVCHHRSCKGNEVMTFFKRVDIVPIFLLLVLLEVLVHLT